MVRSVAERAYLPARNLLEEIGDMMILTGRTISSAVRPPYPYGGEFVAQFLFALRLVWFPLLISTVAICYGAPGLQAANFLTIFGALDRLGGFFVLAAIREIGPSVTGVVVVGVAGTAITADLGARKVREELDALQVLGVDPVKNLVVPRFLALMIGAITGGTAHLVTADGQEPGDPQACGWRQEIGVRGRVEYRPRGAKVGWIDGMDLYLEPEVSYRIAQKLARDADDGLLPSNKTLHKRLHEHGLLASTELARGKLTVRRTLEEARRVVLHLRVESLGLGESAQTAQDPDDVE